MFLKVILTLAMVALTVNIHAVGIAKLLKLITKHDGWKNRHGIWAFSFLLIGLTLWLLVIHLLEVSIWAMFYFWQGCLPDILSSFYFSGTTYTTLGYGDLLLPQSWKMLAPIQALLGILMCGLSTGFFFAIVSARIDPWIKEKVSKRKKQATT